MQGHRYIRIGAIAAALFALTTVLRAAEPRADGHLHITLQPEVQVADRVVRIADVARISGGNAVLREQIGALDLAELDDVESTVEIERALVVARLLLSGAAPADFQVSGAPAAQVSWQSGHGTEHRALDAARKAIAHQLSLPTADVVVQFSQPLPAEIRELIEATDPAQLEARLVTPPGGRTRVDLWLSDGRGGQTPRPIAVDVRFRQLTPVAIRPLTARQKLVADDIALESRDLPQRGVAMTLEQLTGKTLRRSVATGEIVAARDLVATVDEKAPVLIKPRDVVRVSAKKKNLTLELPTAEALQSGRLGESIRVRNTTSGRIVVGRVTGPGEVEVPL